MHETTPLATASWRNPHRSVPRMNKRTKAARATFLTLLSKIGNVTLACHGAGMPRSQAYKLRDLDPAFADAWEQALDLGVAGLEDRAMELALAGNDRLIMFLLQARKPEVYGQRSTVEVNGNLSLALKRAPIDKLRAELAGLLTAALPTDGVVDC